VQLTANQVRQTTGTTGVYTVTDTISHIDPVLVALTLDAEALETTPEHPFYVLLRGWVEADDLQRGDYVRQADGAYGVVSDIAFVARTQPMYNLTVAQAHTFFVGDGRWLVHNAVVPCPSGGGDMVNGRKPINHEYAGNSMSLPASAQANGHTSISFSSQGYADFSPFATTLTANNTVTLPVGRRNRTSDFTDSDRLAGITERWRKQHGLTWHHHEDGITMILVPTNVHDYVRHTGGVATTKP
jgi:hypothetical protein